MSSSAPVPSLPLDSATQAALEQLAARLGPDGLLWASGYLAGLARATGASLPLPATSVPTGDGVVVLTASQTGNARRLGEKLRERLVAAGQAVRVVPAGEGDAKTLSAARTLFAVASTQGDGEPPDEARGLWELLAGRKAPKLDGTAFAVFGLGDSSYPQFCEAGKFLDERFAALGGRRLLARVDADVEYADEAEAWLGAAVAAVPVPAVGHAAVSITAWAPSAPVLRDADRDHPREVAVLAAQRIVARQASRAVVHYELAGGEGFAYEPGDALGIWPHNPPGIVERVLARLGGAAADRLVTRGKQERPLGEWLGQHLELTRLARPFLEAQAERSGAAELAALLEASPAGTARLSAFVAGADVAGVLERFPVQPGREWTAAELLGVLRPLAPRLYSIASSRRAVGDEVHLTVATVPEGAASNHLLERGLAGAMVTAYLERNTHFRLPADTARDVIMIGPGTGVAPFRAFVQERAELGATGRNWLFFGARHFDTEFLYQLEWQQALKKGVLHRLDLAFSRDQERKIYVQDRLRERGAELWSWLQGGASLYVCGDATRMAPDVHAALREVAQHHGNLDTEAAEAWLSELSSTKRYLRDVY
ncbi:MAG: sulfite reductase flavoprotein subunit alpha [Gammaproteobacteria bacterium]